MNEIIKVFSFFIIKIFFNIDLSALGKLYLVALIPLKLALLANNRGQNRCALKYV